MRGDDRLQRAAQFTREVHEQCKQVMAYAEKMRESWEANRHNPSNEEMEFLIACDSAKVGIEAAARKYGFWTHGDERN